MKDTVKVYLLWVGGEFYGAFGNRDSAADKAEAKIELGYSYSYDIDEQRVTKYDLESLVEGDVDEQTWDGLMSGTHHGFITPN